MGSPWDKWYTFVSLELDFVAQISNSLSTYNLINKARNDALLGALTVTHEELDYLTSHLIPETDQKGYEDYLQAVLLSPDRYSFNGVLASHLSMRDKLAAINASWDANKLAHPEPP